MNRMRFSITLLIAWLFLFYNVERLNGSIDISSIAYTFVPCMAIFTILIFRFRKVSLWILLAAPIPIFLITKAVLAFDILGEALTLTITELSFTAVTTILSYWVSKGIGEFEQAVSHITIGQIDTLVEPFSQGQLEMYKELKRARNHQRPLSLMAVSVEEKSIQVALDRMVQETQQAMMKQYVLSDIAKILCKTLEDYNVIARSNGHFIVLLPEITSMHLADLSQRLREIVSEQVGAELQIGAACFPDDAATFEGLMKKAVGNMVPISELPSLESQPAFQQQTNPLATDHSVSH